MGCTTGEISTKVQGATASLQNRRSRHHGLYDHGRQCPTSTVVHTAKVIGDD
jgi:hypothetical protein